MRPEEPDQIITTAANNVIINKGAQKSRQNRGATDEDSNPVPFIELNEVIDLTYYAFHLAFHSALTEKVLIIEATAFVLP